VQSGLIETNSSKLFINSKFQKKMASTSYEVDETRMQADHLTIELLVETETAKDYVASKKKASKLRIQSAIRDLRVMIPPRHSNSPTGYPKQIPICIATNPKPKNPKDMLCISRHTACMMPAGSKKKRRVARKLVFGSKSKTENILSRNASALPAASLTDLVTTIYENEPRVFPSHAAPDLDVSAFLNPAYWEEEKQQVSAPTVPQKAVEFDTSTFFDNSYWE
jgi:hypothetical protein